MRSLERRADCTHHFGLLNVKIGAQISRGDIASQYEQWSSALCRFADSRDGVAQPRTRMNADKNELVRKTRIGISHACRISLMSRRDVLHASAAERICNLEICGSQHPEASPSPHFG
jgi:hypothetical protein